MLTELSRDSSRSGSFQHISACLAMQCPIRQTVEDSSFDLRLQNLEMFYRELITTTDTKEVHTSVKHRKSSSGSLDPYHKNGIK